MVPVVVSVPVAVRAPLVPVRIVPGVSSTPATVPCLIQLCPGVVRLPAMFAMLVNFFPVVILRLLNPVLAIGAVVGRRSGRNYHDTCSSQRGDRKYTGKFAFHLCPPRIRPGGSDIAFRSKVAPMSLWRKL